jgi:prepilin-type processing-associated H-X9-DG protein
LTIAANGQPRQNGDRQLPSRQRLGDLGLSELLRGVELPPRGANFAFVDGSVRFLKETINSWPYNSQTGVPINVSLDANGFFVLAPGSQGVYQALSTRNGGEVISVDAY